MRIGLDIAQYLYMVPVVLISLSFHEFAHAYVSYRLGDPTAKNMGRLTMNPLKHLDILGTIMMFIAQIGWAKPVPINPFYYKDSKKGTMLVSVAGPLSNILLATIFAFPMLIIEKKYNLGMLYFMNSTDYRVILYTLFSLLFNVNIGLAVFNIIPVPPLDGYKVLSGILPSREYYRLMQYENFIGMIFLFIVIAFPQVLTSVLSPFRWVVQTAIMFVVDPLVNLII